MYVNCQGALAIEIWPGIFILKNCEVHQNQKNGTKQPNGYILSAYDYIGRGDLLSRKKIYEVGLPHRSVAVYLYLKDRANKEGICYPAIGTIARELSLSPSTVKRAIGDLGKDGFICKKQRWRENGGRSSLLFEILK